MDGAREGGRKRRRKQGRERGEGGRREGGREENEGGSRKLGRKEEVYRCTGWEVSWPHCELARRLRECGKGRCKLASPPPRRWMRGCSVQRPM